MGGVGAGGGWGGGACAGEGAGGEDGGGTARVGGECGGEDCGSWGEVVGWGEVVWRKGWWGGVVGVFRRGCGVFVGMGENGRHEGYGICKVERVEEM